jgi:hypothetical protein
MTWSGIAGIVGAKRSRPVPPEISLLQSPPRLSIGLLNGDDDRTDIGMTIPRVVDETGDDVCAKTLSGPCLHSNQIVNTSGRSRRDAHR